ncbi:MAG: GTA-gp10 family protein [Erythrobacter sp.]|nr:GTA-gp10 family protein [Erythrobacter sp.]
MVSIKGRPFVLRPTFQNLVLAEEELGSLFALVERASDGAITLGEITALIWHCLPANDRPDREAVGEAVLALGLVSAAKPVRTILAQVLQGQG